MLGDSTQKSNSGATRVIVMGLVVALLAMLLTVVVAPSNALAAGCGSQSSFGCDSGSGGTGGNGSGSGGGAPLPPATGGGGSGGGGGSNPDVRIDRVIPDPGVCPYRTADGKSAIGVDYQWATIYKYGTKDTPPDPYYYWGNPVYTPGYGYLYSTEVLLGHSCLYPPMTYLTTHTCYISSTSTVSMLKPAGGNFKPVTRTNTSGYSQGSMDYNACMNSNSEVELGVAISEKGFYTSKAYSLAQIATIEVAYTPDGITGQIPAPKIVGLSGVFQTAPKNATGSLHCLYGWESEGVDHGDWTETPCSSQNSTNPSYVCSSDAVLYNGYNFGKTPEVQSMRDGSDNKLEFNQSIKGDSINVEKEWTTFNRSADSSPWSSTLKENNNLVQLDVLTRNGTRLTKQFADHQGLNRGLQSAKYDGILNTAFLLGFQASDKTPLIGKNGIEVKDSKGEPVWIDQPTKITQVVDWAGTRTMQSAIITSIDTRNGVMKATPITVTVPTTGTCSQTASITFIRAIGDTVPN